MLIDIITIFPKMFSPVLNESIIKRAQAKGKAKIRLHDLRDYTSDKHRKVDDRPFGGGAGMLMRPEPIFNAVESLAKKGGLSQKKRRVILLSPQGKRLEQKSARRLSKYSHLILVCGHYQGVDERVAGHLADEEVSIGDYILTGGELPAMVLVDALVRLLPGVLGDKNSLNFESFEDNLLESPHYTRPAFFKGMKVPEVLLSGDHKRIEAWRRKEALKKTRRKRPGLLKSQ
ncbi:MAG: tRNA (guanosine(37)-N1)-methyltransferase TrmD [Candidatus Omnitrophota bacterium]